MLTSWVLSPNAKTEIEILLGSPKAVFYNLRYYPRTQFSSIPRLPNLIFIQALIRAQKVGHSVI